MTNDMPYSLDSIMVMPWCLNFAKSRSPQFLTTTALAKAAEAEGLTKRQYTQAHLSNLIAGLLENFPVKCTSTLHDRSTYP